MTDHNITLTPMEYADLVQDIHDAGHAEGREQGYQDGLKFALRASKGASPGFKSRMDGVVGPELSGALTRAALRKSYWERLRR